MSESFEEIEDIKLNSPIAEETQFAVKFELIKNRGFLKPKIGIFANNVEIGYLYYEHEHFEKLQVCGGQLVLKGAPNSSIDNLKILRHMLGKLKSRYQKDIILPIRRDQWDKAFDWEQMKVEGLIEIPKAHYS